MKLSVLQVSQFACSVLLSIALAACGGGGGNTAIIPTSSANPAGALELTSSGVVLADRNADAHLPKLSAKAAPAVLATGASAYFTTVERLYIAFYQRPADPAGLVYWANAISAANGNASAVIDAFAGSAEATALYGPINSISIGTVLDAFYAALFGHAPDPAGKAYYVNAFNVGTFTAATIALNVLNGATGTDATSVANKTTVATSFTQQVDGRQLTDPNFGSGSSFAVTYNTNNVVAARTILKAVTASLSSVLSQDQVATVLQVQIASPTDPIQTATATGALTNALLRNQIDNFRLSLGLQLYKHDARLDNAAQNHSQYVLTKWYLGNGQVNQAIGSLDPVRGVPMAHIEDPSVPGFTGITVTDRAVAAGYPGQAGEDITMSSPQDINICVSKLVNTIYHRLLFTSPVTDVGVGTAVSSDGKMAVCTLDSGLIGTPVSPPVNWVGVYPIPGQTNVPTLMTIETPDPIPSVPIKGAPVNIYIGYSNQLQVTIFTLAVSATGMSVPVKILTIADSSNLQGQAFMVPVGALATGTQYTANFVGSNNGTPITKSWNFTTQ